MNQKTLNKNKPILKEEILTYLSTYSRNKIVFHSTPIDDVYSHNIGVLLAESIEGIKDDNRLSLKVNILIDELLNSCIVTHKVYGKILAIQNIGILMEPDLKLDLNNLIRKYSDTNTLLINWQGIIENDCIYFLTKEAGVRIDIKNLSHITV
jgi:hypothetical protein